MYVYLPFSWDWRRQVHIDLIHNILIHAQTVLLLLHKVQIVLIDVVVIVIDIVGYRRNHSKNRYFMSRPDHSFGL